MIGEWGQRVWGAGIKLRREKGAFFFVVGEVGIQV